MFKQDAETEVLNDFELLKLSPHKLLQSVKPSELFLKAYRNDETELFLYEWRNLPYFIKIKECILDSSFFSRQIKEIICNLINFRLRIEFSLHRIRRKIGDVKWENFENYSERLCRYALSSPPLLDKFFHAHRSLPIIMYLKRLQSYLDPVCINHSFVTAFFTMSGPDSNIVNQLKQKDDEDAIWLLISPLSEKRIRAFQSKIKTKIQEILAFISRLSRLDGFTKEVLKHYVNLRLKIEYSASYQPRDFLRIDKFWRGYENMSFFELLYNDKNLSDTLLNLIEELSQRTTHLLHPDILYYDFLDCRNYEYSKNNMAI